MFIVDFFLGVLMFPVVFYVLIAAMLVGLCFATENDHLGSGLWITLFGSALCIAKFGTFANVFAAIKGDPLIVLGCILAYLLAGTLWFLFKWYLFSLDEVTRIQVQIDRQGKDATAEFYAEGYHREEKEEHRKLILSTDFACLSPKITDYKHKVTTWIALWVPSALWFLLNDPIRRIVNSIYNSLKGVAQGISDKVFKNAFKK